MFKAKVPPNREYNIEVEDELIITVDSDLRLLSAETYSPALEAWLPCTDQITAPLFDKYTPKIIKKILEADAADGENDTLEDAV